MTRYAPLPSTSNAFQQFIAVGSTASPKPLVFWPVHLGNLRPETGISGRPVRPERILVIIQVEASSELARSNRESAARRSP